MRTVLPVRLRDIAARHPLLVITLVGWSVRLLYLRECMNHPEFLLPTIDATTYHHFARQWVVDGLRDSTTAWHSAFYPLFLAGVYHVVGPSILAAKILQALLGAITCAGLFYLTRHAFGSRAGWIAGLGMALYGPLIFYDLELVSAGWSVTWSTLILASLVIPLPERALLRGLLHGALAAGGALIRPELLVGYIAGKSLHHGWLAWTGPTPWRPSLRMLAGFGAAFVLLVVPIGILNHPFTGSLSFLPVNSGLNLYLANSPTPCQTMIARPGPDYDRIVHEPKRFGHMDAASQNRYFQHLVWETHRDDPMELLRHIGLKVILLVQGKETTSDIDVYAAREPSWILTSLVWKVGAFGFPFSVILVLGLTGLVNRGMKPLHGAVWVYAVVILMLLIYLPTARYRLLLVPPLLMLSGGMIDQLLVARRSGVSAYRPAAIAVGLIALVVQLLPPFVCPTNWDYRAERYRMIGQQLDDPEQARQWLERSWRLSRQDPQTAFFLGLAAHRNGETSSALTYLDHALDLAPDYAMARMLRSDILTEQGDLEEAVRDLTAAVEAQPDFIDALVRLGLLYRRLDDPLAAMQAFHQARQVDPRHPDPRIHLALLYSDQDRPMDAAQLLDELIADLPHLAELRLHAAMVAKMLGQDATARHHLLEAARLTPDDPRIDDLREAWRNTAP